MTFSIAARCGRTGMLGIAVASSSAAVAARCAHVRAGAGAAASQNITDPRLGTLALDLMAAGWTAPEAIEKVKREGGELIAYRQLTAVDRAGRTAAFSGQRTLGTHASAEGPGVVCAGNILKTANVPEAMRDAFLGAEGRHLGDRLIAAVQAGLDAGGEEGPIHSIGLGIVRDVPWPIADLRIDWHDSDPVGALRALWERWQGQMEDYVIRALDPAKAPSFGVPGDK
jgi:uncharacterized Ntn-hydrolase superfamily protein